MLLKEAYTTSLDLAKKNKESWVGCIKELLKYLKLDFIFEKPDNFKTSFIIRKVEVTLYSKFFNIWKNNISNDKGKTEKGGNKLRTYNTFKSNFTFEPYLMCGNRDQRRILTKFRISDHPLEIERGRYFGLEVKDRKCKLCNVDIEDEVHFLIKCEQYKSFRNNYFRQIYLNNKNFKDLSDKNKLIWLMSCEDKHIVTILFQMLGDFYNTRNIFLRK